MDKPLLPDSRSRVSTFVTWITEQHREKQQSSQPDLKVVGIPRLRVGVSPITLGKDLWNLYVENRGSGDFLDCPLDRVLYQFAPSSE